MSRRKNRLGRILALGFFSVWAVALIVFMLMRRSFQAGRDLIRAAERGRVHEVERLLNNGALTNMRNRDGYTALWLAASNGNTEVVDLLLNHGANPNQRSADGTTALMEAARLNRVGSVRSLLAHHADPNAEGDNQETALTLAEQAGSVESAAELRSAGAEASSFAGESLSPPHTPHK